MEQQASPSPPPSGPRINTKVTDNGVLEITGNFQLMLEKKKQILALFGLPEDTRFDSLQFKSLVPKDPFYKKVLGYLNNCLDVPQDDDFDPETILEFHADWIRKNLTPPPIESFTEFPENISIIHASLLIDTFSSNQNENFQFRGYKNFLYSKTILNLNLLAPLPMAFQYVPQMNVIQVTFANTPTITAQQIHRQFLLCKNIFNTIRGLRAQFHNVCPEHYNNKDFKDLYNSLQSTFIVFPPQYDPASKGELISFEMYVLPSKPGRDFREGLKQKLTTYYQRNYEARYCPRCKQYYPQLSTESDTCGIYEHEGEQIPFEDGQLEHTEVTPEGESITTVKYLCCGEVIKGSRPVEYMHFDDFHLPDDSNKQYSSLDITDFNYLF